MALLKPPDPEKLARYVDLYRVVSLIPPGKATTYGMLGRALKHPLIAREVGGAMRHARDPIPWHRVVGSGPKIVVQKRDPRLGEEQLQRLIAEGYPLTKTGGLDSRGLLSMEELIELADRH